jgi:predicted RNA-binding Zn-ribbon protein involved in translation (DUF1610 family)
MIRFHCGHCGHRIAVQKRQLGTMIVCPDCGQATHPIAEQVIKQRTASAQRANPKPALVHACANCTQAIGRLEKLHLWDNKVVCGKCHQKLSEQTSVAARLPAPSPTTAITVTRRAESRALTDDRDAMADPLAHMLTRPFRGGLFGALVGLCVAGAALYGALSLLKDVAGLITGLAIGGLALLLIYLAVRATLSLRKGDTGPQPAKRARMIERR